MADHERYRNAEQVLQRHIRAMGDDLGRVYNELSNSVSRLHVKWRIYRQLYSHSAERVDLLNRTAGWCFRVLQGALIGDVLLHIGRVTDQERIGGRENLTIRQLPALVADQVRVDVETLVGVALTACEPIRAWRNRRGAHTDRETAILGIPLPGITDGQVEAVLTSLRVLLNRVEQHYWDGPTMYEHIVIPPGDGDALIHYLLRGLRADEARDQRLRSGNPLPEDLTLEELR